MKLMTEVFKLRFPGVLFVFVFTMQTVEGAIRLDLIVQGLTSPLYVTNAHDGTRRLFIVEQPGRIKVIPFGTTTPSLFLDITSKVLSGGERGLLGLAFHPQFASNSRFFVNYTRQTDGATVIAEYRASSDPLVTAASERIILTIAQPFSNHNGGMIEFGRDGYLYIAMGDGGSANDPQNRAQNINELLGKMLRIDVDNPAPNQMYSSPPSNPFAGAIPGRDEIFALGLRNPFRFSFDRLTGQLYAGDVGQNQLEEVDIITAGGNYGWRVYEGNQCTGLDPGLCNPANFVPPIAQYGHSGGRCSITGGYAYRGSAAALPAGTYIYGDYCTGEIFSLGSSAALLDTSLNISSFGEDEDGEIYVTGLGGTVHRIAAISLAATTTTLVSSTNPSMVGAPVTFTATVTGTNPSGGVSFTSNGGTISGCASIGLTGSGNSKTAVCSTGSLTAGTHSIVASYSGDANNSGSSSVALSQVVNAAGTANVALASAGATASASSTYTAYPVSAIINNERAGMNWGGGRVWVDGTFTLWPDSVEIFFNGNKTIDRVVVYSVQDNYANPVEPSDIMTFSAFGAQDFTVQGLSGSSWITLATVTNNNLVKRSVSFAPTTVDAIRITIARSAWIYSLLTEVEAWGVAGGLSATTTTLVSSPNPSMVGQPVTFTATVTGMNPSGSVIFSANGGTISGCASVGLTGSGNSKISACSTGSLTGGTHTIVASYGGDAANSGSSSVALSQVVTAAGSVNVALASAGAAASASSTYTAYPVSAIINNERAGMNWGGGRVWVDGTFTLWPDSVEIFFNGNKTIDRVVVYSVQDNYANPVEPSDIMTFSALGAQDYTLQGRSGSSWITLATVTNNNLVKRSVSFSPITVDAVRITITRSAWIYSVLTEVEAWGTP